MVPLTQFTRFDQWSGPRALVSRQRRKPGVTAMPPSPDWLQRAQNGPGIRADKVQAIREALAAGTYDVDARIESIVSIFGEDPPPRPAA